MEIEINKFKKIDRAVVNLSALNIFIGSNNSGKSSFIQGVQFAISACQALELKKASWTKGGTRTLSLDSSEFLYAPTKNVESLYHGKRLTGARKRGDRSEIKFIFKEGANKAVLTISKGKNGGFTTSLEGGGIGGLLGNIGNPFCVYVPGIAGIPTQEKHEVTISVRKSATRGDSNSYLRNILHGISGNDKKWKSFISSVKSIYGDVDISVDFDEDKSEYIYVNVNINSIEVPLDTVGTGLLQVIQIFAYIEYFSPKLILLDEPDAHIHPTKQRRLAEELAKKTIHNKDLKIVFSTHSRYILEALEDRANVVHFQEGRAFDGVKNSGILVDIGAADSDYLFGRKKLKYIIATEDKVDNVNEKKDFLKKFLLANGVLEEEMVMHSYEGCTKVHFAKILEGFVSKHIPGAKVILHIDRDQKSDSDHELIKLKADCDRDGIALFVTKYQEIESYFCLPDHVNKACGIPLPEANRQYELMIDELKEPTVRRLTNFILRERPELAQNTDGRQDIDVIHKTANDWYCGNKYGFTLGKELLGKTKKYVGEVMKLNPDDLLKITDGLKCEEFQRVFQKLTAS